MVTHSLAEAKKRFAKADKTTEHIVLMCAGLELVQPADCERETWECTLAGVLGFKVALSLVVDSANKANGSKFVDAKPMANGGWGNVVETTKRRLENWWLLIQQRG